MCVILGCSYDEKPLNFKILWIRYNSRCLNHIPDLILWVCICNYSSCFIMNYSSLKIIKKQIVWICKMYFMYLKYQNGSVKQRSKL